MKLMVTPTVVLTDYLAYGKLVSAGQGAGLICTCVGVGLATVNDVHFNWHGAVVAALAVGLAVTQKLLNSHLQQRCNTSTLQLMRQAFPYMTVVSLLFAPLIDAPGLMRCEWLTSKCVSFIALSAAAAFCATWSATAIFGLIGALAHVLLGQVKTCFVLLVGAVAFDARINAKGLVGSALAVGSIAVYTFLSMRESTKDSVDEGLPLKEDDADGVATDLTSRGQGHRV
uniref:Sugar phosphate transporter domain-containing protein n=1 Tax=Calcidiscus leptoporus TaxID=127549 RepID=A0A7S0NZT5_9EUKA|mmetsp:Transcript_43990/g.102897  ORF Transcript_43990/g.102897 Transcript_43990/m.102897 type:complete len:228 (+) Transcript_43990:1-684(+)